MQIKEHHVFYFSRKEKNGIILILLINLLIYFLPDMVDHFIPEKNELKFDTDQFDTADSNINQAALTANFKNKQIEQSREFILDKKNKLVQYFEFDPNHCNKEEWLKLGVKEKTISTIQHYLSKGGHFKKPEDLKKIWGFTVNKLDELMPFVKIKNDQVPKEYPRTSNNNYKSEAPKIINLNAADSALLESLPGIGPALSRRIIVYKNKLGGFYEVNQLKEVWGLQDSVYQKIEKMLDVNGETKKIDINLVSFDELKSHPYFGYKLANTIINYRNQHGSFKSLDDIQKINLIDQKTFNLITHYLMIK